MRTATATEAKNSLGGLLALVKRGETVVITSHGRPIAKLTPIDSGSDGRDAEVLEGLIARGILAPPQRAMDALDIEFICSGPMPQMPEGWSAAELIGLDRGGR